jgi:hypothetical protein
MLNDREKIKIKNFCSLSKLFKNNQLKIKNGKKTEN